MFQRRHFEMIAACLARSRPARGSGAPVLLREQWNADRNALADLFAANNPNFSRERFITACERVVS